MVSGPKFTVLFSLTLKERCSAPGFQILDISIRFGDIRAQSRKFSMFLPPQLFLGGGNSQTFGPAFIN